MWVWFLVCLRYTLFVLRYITSHLIFYQSPSLSRLNIPSFLFRDTSRSWIRHFPSGQTCLLPATTSLSTVRSTIQTLVAYTECSTHLSSTTGNLRQMHSSERRDNRTCQKIYSGSLRLHESETCGLQRPALSRRAHYIFIANAESGRVARSVFASVCSPGFMRLKAVNPSTHYYWNRVSAREWSALLYDIRWSAPKALLFQNFPCAWIASDVLGQALGL